MHLKPCSPRKKKALHQKTPAVPWQTNLAFCVSLTLQISAMQKRHRCATRCYQTLWLFLRPHICTTPPRTPRWNSFLLGERSASPHGWAPRGPVFEGDPEFEAVKGRRADFWALHLRRAQKNQKSYPCNAVGTEPPIDRKNGMGGNKSCTARR